MKRNKNLLFTMIGVIMLLFAFTCSHYSKFVEVYTESPKPIPRFWVIKSISIEQRVPDRELEKKVPEILSMLGTKFGISIYLENSRVPEGNQYALLNLWIKEQSYNRSLDQYNSIAGLMTITKADGGEILARAVYSEDSEDSIKSFQRLYMILEELLKALGTKVSH